MIKHDNTDISKLNEFYSNLSVEKRITKFYNDYGKQSILCTSSFGTTSGCLLSLISKISNGQKVHFIDTGNHFLETYEYKARLSEILNLKVESISAGPEVHQLAFKHKLWRNNAEYCCHIKKVKPLSLLKRRYNFWITGLQYWQTKTRSNMAVFERSGNLIKFNPLIDLSKNDCYSIMNKNSIPPHPLYRLGYDSVSCIFCTRMGKNREGRWAKTSKTECGLHNQRNH